MKVVKTIVNYEKIGLKVRFDTIEDKECFYSGGALYMKILQQDLKHYKIDNVNAISILNAGLTLFESDETVYKATKEQINAKLIGNKNSF